MIKLKVFILLLILTNLYFVFIQWPKEIDQITPESKKMPIKSILIWNSPNRLEMARTFGAGTEAFVQNGCHVTQCQIVRNRSAMPFVMYDAVVMNMLELTDLPEQEGFKRQKHQRYVFLSQESPLTINLNTSNFEDYFNWTMSYKKNSDVLMLYGSVTAKTD
jgi:alpha-1,3-fucosyltransferase